MNKSFQSTSILPVISTLPLESTWKPLLPTLNPSGNSQKICYHLNRKEEKHRLFANGPLICIKNSSQSSSRVRISGARVRGSLDTGCKILKSALQLIFVLCVYVCVCAYIYTYTNMHIHTHIYIYIHIHIYMYTYIYMYVCIKLKSSIRYD